jgi:hypothetical protein
MKALNVIGGTIVGAAFLAAGAAASIPVSKIVTTDCTAGSGSSTITLSDGSKIEAPGAGCSHIKSEIVADGNLLHRTVRDVAGWVL